jgi:S-adenosylmethionine decarboxylase
VKILGRHLLVEYCECDKGLLDNIALLETHMKDAVRVSGATIVQSVFHRYNPQGVSGVIVIAESHLSIHTWPEYGYAAVDFFTCGESVDPYKAFAYMKSALGSKESQVTDVNRGMPSDTVDEVIAHKNVTPIYQSAASNM